jgi:hypothetical protein
MIYDLKKWYSGMKANTSQLDDLVRFFLSAFFSEQTELTRLACRSLVTAVVILLPSNRPTSRPTSSASRKEVGDAGGGRLARLQTQCSFSFPVTRFGEAQLEPSRLPLLPVHC